MHVEEVISCFGQPQEDRRNQLVEENDCTLFTPFFCCAMIYSATIDI